MRRATALPAVMQLLALVALLALLGAPAVAAARSRSSSRVPVAGQRPAAAPARSLSLAIDAACSYAVQVNGAAWLQSGDAGVFVNGGWTGRVSSVSSTGEGVDTLGAYSSSACLYKDDDGQEIMRADFRVYEEVDAIVFTQTILLELNGTAQQAVDGVSSSFPSFRPAAQTPLGFLSYTGRFMEDTSAGVWRASADIPANLASGVYAGPTVLFPATNSPASGSSPVLMLSSFSSFMSASAGVSVGRASGVSELQLGVMSTAESLPANYSVSHILVLGQRGIYETIQLWGDLQRAWNGKPERVFERDPHVRALSYNTDRGAAYWYNTEDGGTEYEKTLRHVREQADEQRIPYQSILLDSWWYFKGDGSTSWLGNGVTNWTAMPSVFPNGLLNLTQTLQWPIVAHNRWWSNMTTYATRNGGDFHFLFDDDNAAAIPQDEAFWDFLFAQAVEWGLTVYEQDWLDEQFLLVSAAQTDVTVAQRWLDQLGFAAARHNLFVQMCMPMPRHVLSSLQYSAVSQIRATDDYLPGNENWKIGYTTPIIQAVGAVPLKDTWWSSTNAADVNAYYLNATEPAPALQAAIATLSTGPVSPGDALGQTDRTLVMKSCREDGLLLKPDVPLRYTDSKIRQDALQDGSGPQGDVFLTTATLGGSVPYNSGVPAHVPLWPTVLVANLSAPYKFDISELPVLPTRDGKPSDAQYVAWVWHKSTGDPVPQPLSGLVSAAAPLVLNPCASVADFSVYYLSPVLPVGKGLALLGEWSKWAPISRQRMPRMEFDSAGSLRVTLAGTPNEAVSIAVATADGKVSTATCTLNDYGHGLFAATLAGDQPQLACTN